MLNFIFNIIIIVFALIIIIIVFVLCIFILIICYFRIIFYFLLFSFYFIIVNLIIKFSKLLFVNFKKIKYFAICNVFIACKNIFKFFKFVNCI